MRHIIVLLILAGLAWHGYGKYQRQEKQPFLIEQPVVEQHSERSTTKAFNEPLVAEQPTTKMETPVASANYRCDGRVYCSQMASCAEATWFLRNCPGTKMDGDNDGIPCEQQWCGK